MLKATRAVNPANPVMRMPQHQYDPNMTHYIYFLTSGAGGASAGRPPVFGRSAADNIGFGVGIGWPAADGVGLSANMICDSVEIDGEVFRSDDFITQVLPKLLDNCGATSSGSWDVYTCSRIEVEFYANVPQTTSANANAS